MSTLRRLGRIALDAILPPLCLSCADPVGEPGTLCPECWGEIDFLGPPLCDCCGHPFEVDAGPGAMCGPCTISPPPWQKARAVFRYDASSKALILRFKHADRLEGAPTFGLWLARAGADLLVEIDLIVPVPLHRWRLFTRRYNQAALLANAVAKVSGKPVLPQALIRCRRTPAQGHLGRDERHSNVKGAFAVASIAVPAVAGRRVLLIDDVLTTGATVAECARTLTLAGAASVNVLTLARVVLPHG